MSEFDRNNGILRVWRNIRHACVTGHCFVIVRQHQCPEAVIQSSEDVEARRAVINQLREIWVLSDSDTVSADIERARALAAAVPESAQKEADAFVRAMERLGDWLRSG